MWRDKRKKRVIYTIYSSLPVTHLFLKIFLHATIYWIFFKEEENFKDSITRLTLQLLHRHERAKLSKNNFRFQLNNASSLSQRMKKKKNESSFSWKFIARFRYVNFNFRARGWKNRRGAARGPEAARLARARILPLPPPRRGKLILRRGAIIHGRVSTLWRA